MLAALTIAVGALNGGAGSAAAVPPPPLTRPRSTFMKLRRFRGSPLQEIRPKDGSKEFWKAFYLKVFLTSKSRIPPKNLWRGPNRARSARKFWFSGPQNRGSLSENALAQRARFPSMISHFFGIPGLRPLEKFSFGNTKPDRSSRKLFPPVPEFPSGW